MTADVNDATLVKRLAQGSGEILKGVRNVGLLRSQELGKAGDSLAQDWIARALAVHRPQDAVLSEEAPDDLQRLTNERVWIIDPLDGTKEYASGRQDWAVHVALAENGVITHAAVGMPDLGHVFHTGDIHAVGGPQTNRLVVSQNSAPAIAEFIAEDTGMELVLMGSCGAKVISVVLGDNDAYVHAGGQYEWDNAAPAGVARAAGLHTSRLDGTDLSYNHESTYLPDMLVCRPDVKDKILASAKKFHDEHGGFSL
ncbi:3'(2'),5'-bisphosphate nucleotidase CysQ [Corynebacterium heidelbergense]|uniref:3'(2'),5-bisphosphonucleoside 3'(2')-phosphohydrolase n=1 Tax=Corynebacterium heidelbergense TaxID=2055947 RepID=A0A364V435_9CORY|nr:3'(2'),5'-bisphosphate nucleotidase CysQ [Corynebacterium heidelbergense]RAV31392.1 3'(2'),5'-bisphosphate nucleotidase CysQ [Corynebacterium heidelbergense]